MEGHCWQGRRTGKQSRGPGASTFVQQVFPDFFAKRLFGKKCSAYNVAYHFAPARATGGSRVPGPMAHAAMGVPVAGKPRKEPTGYNGRCTVLPADPPHDE